MSGDIQNLRVGQNTHSAPSPALPAEHLAELGAAERGGMRHGLLQTSAQLSGWSAWLSGETAAARTL